MRASSRILLSAIALGAGAGTAQAATIPVTTTTDAIAADGLCSLREAVFAARYDQAVQGCPAGTSGDDLIQLEAGDYRLTAGGPPEDGNTAGDLDTGPSNVLRIAGRGMGATTISAISDRVIQVFAGAGLGLADLTIRDGLAGSGGDGGAIQNRGTLTVLRVAFVNNTAGDGQPGSSFDEPEGEPGGGGGAIWSDGQMQVASSVFQSNRAARGADARLFINPANPNNTRSASAGAGGSGGAIQVAGGTAAITGSTFTGSRAGSGGSNNAGVPYAGAGDGGNGGAIGVSGGSATVENSTFVGNTAGNGGSPRIRYEAPPVAPGSGGAVSAVAPGTMSVTFSTFSGNAVGGGDQGSTGTGTSVSGGTVSASILADGGGACATAAPAPLANLVLSGDNTCAGASIVGDPRLGPFVDNGGPVPTIAPGAGSPAIDALVGVPCPATDARGLGRPSFAGCDIGAVEIQPGAPGAPGPPAPAPGGSGAALGSRTITALTVGPTTFRSSGRKPLGTNVRFRLGTAGRVVITVRRPAAGKRSNRRCVAPTRKLRAARSCTRQVTLPGTLTRQGVAGENLIRFSGKLNGRALPAGRYTLVVTLPRTGSSPALTAVRAFRIAS